MLSLKFLEQTAFTQGFPHPGGQLLMEKTVVGFCFLPQHFLLDSHLQIFLTVQKFTTPPRAGDTFGSYSFNQKLCIRVNE